MALGGSPDGHGGGRGHCHVFIYVRARVGGEGQGNRDHRQEITVSHTVPAEGNIPAQSTPDVMTIGQNAYETHQEHRQ